MYGSVVCRRDRFVGIHGGADDGWPEKDGPHHVSAGHRLFRVCFFLESLRIRKFVLHLPAIQASVAGLNNLRNRWRSAGSEQRSSQCNRNKFPCIEVRHLDFHGCKSEFINSIFIITYKNRIL
jgi:hypothetical protein